MLQSAELGTVRLAAGWDVPGLEEEEGSERWREERGNLDPRPGKSLFTWAGNPVNPPPFDFS